MRRKLPAYGRDLIAARNKGHHPDRIWVFCGDDWSRLPRGNPSLCIKADQKASEIDWTLCAGLPVHVVDRGGDFVAVAAEVARWAAPVTVHWIVSEADWPDQPGRHAQEDVAWVMFSTRLRTAKGFAFQHGWTDEIESDYIARRETYLSALVADVLDPVAPRAGSWDACL